MPCFFRGEIMLSGKGIVAWVILGSLCLIMALFGVDQGGMGTGTGGYAAIVNGKIVSLLEVQNRYQNESRQRSQRWKGLPAAQRQKESEKLRLEVLQSLVDAELASQSAEKVGLRVSDREIMDWIVSVPAFQEDGVFQEERYQNYLRYVKSSAANFEAQTRRSLAFEKVRNAFSHSLTTTTLEDDKKKMAESTKLNLGFVRFDSKSVAGTYKVSEAKLAEYTASNKDKISKFYETNKNNYKTKEQTRARHILVKAAGDDKSFNQALIKAKNIMKRLETEDFAAVASELSDDTGSKVKGGDLGYFERGNMVKEFETVAFSSPVGKVSEPVKTQYGYHLIKVEDRKSGAYKSLESVSADIARSMMVDEVLETKLEAIKTAAAAGEVQTLDTHLSDLGLKWQNTGEFSLTARMLPKIGDNSKVYTEALKLKQGQSSPVIESDGQYYIVKMNSFTTNAKAEKLAQNDYFQKFMLFQKVQGTLQQWINLQKESSIIKTNSSYYQ